MTRGFLVSMLKVAVNPERGGERSGRRIRCSQGRDRQPPADHLPWRVLAVDGVSTPILGEPPVLVNIVPVWGADSLMGKAQPLRLAGRGGTGLKPPLRDQAGLKGKTLSFPGRIPGLTVKGQCLSSSITPSSNSAANFCWSPLLFSCLFPPLSSFSLYSSLLSPPTAK